MVHLACTRGGVACNRPYLRPSMLSADTNIITRARGLCGLANASPHRGLDCEAKGEGKRGRRDAPAMGKRGAAPSQRRILNGCDGFGREQMGSSVSALVRRRASRGRGKRGRVDAAGDKASTRGREGRSMLASKERPESAADTYIPRGGRRDIERRGRPNVGRPAMGYVTSAHRRAAHDEKHPRQDADTYVTWTPHGRRAVAKWLSPKRSPPGVQTIRPMGLGAVCLGLALRK